jgi:hypothetical protein
LQILKLVCLQTPGQKNRAAYIDRACFHAKRNAKQTHGPPENQSAPATG